MINRIEKGMKERGLLSISSVLVGLSGGADSAALTHALCLLGKKYNFKVYAAHVNHGLRGETAERDEHFSKDFADKMGIEFFLLRADVKKIAEGEKISEELAGRKVRYDFFEQICREHNIEKIATAHHRNDNAETILMNFMRGSGIAGLCGIPYERGNIIRPLLDITRAEIEAYCKENNLSYVTDETNLQTKYTRNKIRNILIPQIEELFNPSFVSTVTKNAEVLRVDEDYLNSEANRVYDEAVSKNSADVLCLIKQHRAIQLRVIRKMTAEICGTADVTSVVFEDIAELVMKNRTGSSIDVSDGVSARIEYNRLIFERRGQECAEFEYALKPGEEAFIPELGYTVIIEKADSRKNDGWEYFSCPADAVIKIRSRRSGDKFIPWGMRGTKKLKDFMIDEKIPKGERMRTGIITIDDKIAWVVGYRRDNRFRFDNTGIKIKIKNKY